VKLTIAVVVKQSGLRGTATRRITLKR